MFINYIMFLHFSSELNLFAYRWPHDEAVLDISEQFMWGDAILFSPILYEASVYSFIKKLILSVLLFCNYSNYSMGI